MKGSGVWMYVWRCGDGMEVWVLMLSVRYVEVCVWCIGSREVCRWLQVGELRVGHVEGVCGGVMGVGRCGSGLDVCAMMGGLGRCVCSVEVCVWCDYGSVEVWR